MADIEPLIDGLIEKKEKKHALTARTYDKGTVIIPLGKRVDKIHFLVEGSCYRKSLTDEGAEIIYEALSPESGLKRFLDVLILYSTTQTSTTTFVAKTACVCVEIEPHDFYEYANQHPDILHAMIGAAINSYDSLDNKYHLRQGGKAANHLCEIIYNSMLEEEGRLVAKIENNSELARHMGIHRVSVVRILKQLEDEGAVKRSKRGLLIEDASAIEAYAKGKRFVYRKKTTES